MFFPIRTDRRLAHTPYINYALIAMNVVVFIVTGYGVSSAHSIAAPYMLFPWQPEWYQFFTYQFLHGDVMHLGFNMLFLYVFGNHLEDRFGPIGYLAFYLAGGVVAGIGYSLTQANPILGASGSVSAVTGAYLALFPASRVTIVYWFVFIGAFEVPSMYLILFNFFQDVFFQFGGFGHVAYLAHISGSLFGVAVGMTLLFTRVLPREPYDFLAMIDRWNRRRQLRSMASRGYSPWMGSPGGVESRRDKSLKPEQQQIMELRADIQRAIEAHQPHRALDAYERLIEVDARQALSRQVQLDLANYAMNEGRYELAAIAYERFLAAYESDSFRPQVEMMLALLYIRYLDAPERARPLLVSAASRSMEPEKRQLAQDLLAEIDQ